MHYARLKYAVPMDAPKRESLAVKGDYTTYYPVVDGAGYVRLTAWVDGQSDYIFEHRYVIQKRLGRSLTKRENVHHINGNKADNRDENLELWNTSQPPGQRVEDKLAWAREMILLYGSEEEAWAISQALRAQE